MPILEVHNIEKHFGDTRVLEDISFDLEQGQALAIIGSSGSGKTTLLRCLNFLETPNQGRIAVNGEVIFDAEDPATQKESEVRKKRLHFGLVFQSFNLFPQYTALKNVTLARELLAQEQPDFKENKKKILEEIQADGRDLLAKMDVRSMSVLALTMSLDALAVGVSLALGHKLVIWWAALSAALVSLAITVPAMSVGHRIGHKAGSKGGAFGGAILILLGLFELLQYYKGF